MVSTWLLEEPATQRQEIQDTQHAPSVSQYWCWLSSTLVVTVVSASTLSYHNKSDLLNKYFMIHCDADCPLELLNTWFNNTPTQSVLILTVPLHLLWSWIHNCIPDVCPLHSRYLTGNLWKILLVWSWIPYGGWMLEYGQIPMKAELVEGVVVLCGRWTVSAEAGVT